MSATWHTDDDMRKAHVWTRYYLVRERLHLQRHMQHHHRHGIMCFPHYSCPVYRYHELHALFLQGGHDIPKQITGSFLDAFQVILSLPTPYQRFAPWRDAEKEMYGYFIKNKLIIYRRIIGVSLLVVGTILTLSICIYLFSLSLGIALLGIAVAIVLISIGAIAGFPHLLCDGSGHMWGAVFEIEGAIHYCARCGEVCLDILGTEENPVNQETAA